MTCFLADTKYKFIIEELFEHEIDDVEIPGLITHYIYEEFHPNHASDIESRAIEFIEGWIDQEMDEDSWELAETFILPDRTTIAKSDVLGKIRTVFDSYKEYTLSSYTFDKIHFELKEETETGMSYAGGFISYEAMLENGEMIHIEGHFYICLSLEYKWWNIFYFDFPGFVW